MSSSKRSFAPYHLNHHPLAIFFKMSQDFVFSDSCTRVHGFEEETNFNVPRYMDLKKKLPWGGGGRGGNFLILRGWWWKVVGGGGREEFFFGI